MFKLFLYFLILLLFTWHSDPEPMHADFSKSASYRWLNKKVLESQMLDDMENLDHWVSYSQGAQQVVDARVDSRASDMQQDIGSIDLSAEKIKSGQHSLKMTIPTRLDAPGPKSGRGWGTAGARRKFDGEDWTNMNRISLWIYPDNPGFYVNWLELRIYNDGTNKLPALFGQEGETSLLLRNHEWNHVVWEIENVDRDKVTSFEISYYLSGNEPGATDIATFYLDRLELQKVDPDHIEGWDVWPGRISYSHSGYLPGALKTAIATGLEAHEFKLIDHHTGEVVLTKPIHISDTHLGAFQLMDFTEVRETGSYILEAGDIRSQPFSIGPMVWRNSILKALNFYYMERCGVAIPGVHGACHRDWTCVHGDKKIVINGGWHDAGDLTQGLGNTAEATYMMFSLAEWLQERDNDPDLLARLLEEAQWGLDWVIKTSFRDGFRNGGSVNSRRTNGIIGDFDDVTSTARNTPMDNFTASATEAIGYRVLKSVNPNMAAISLEMAREDWEFAVEGMAQARESSNKNIFRGTFDSDNVEHLAPSMGIMASVDLWKATGDKRYLTYVAEWADVIVNSQQKTVPDWDVPFTGFFYTGPQKDHIMHYVHHGREHSPILALTQLCEALPEHPDWMKWYATVSLHSEYLKKISAYTAPYHVTPASIYSDQEYLLAPESRQESFRQQVLNGIPLGGGHYLRLFPVWMDYRGHFGTILPQAKALAEAASLRGDLQSLQLAQHQLEWIIGRNPFSQSNMWGEGYDFPPLYSVMSGDMVGGLPVGIQTRGNVDVPYWPVQNSWTYKEIWTFPVVGWFSMMRNVSSPALVEGIADGTVEFIEERTGKGISTKPYGPEGRFKIFVPQGNYTVRSGEVELKRSFLPATNYQMDLQPESFLDFEISQTSSGNGMVKILLSARGEGKHYFELRTANLKVNRPSKEIDLKSGSEATWEWSGNIVAKDMAWVAVVLADQDLSSRKEISGSH